MFKLHKNVCLSPIYLKNYCKDLKSNFYHHPCSDFEVKFALSIVLAQLRHQKFLICTLVKKKKRPQLRKQNDYEVNNKVSQNPGIEEDREGMCELIC